MGMRKLKEDSRYLGNPFLLKRKRKESFQLIIDKIKNKLSAWKAKSLSWAGRATLINSVISSIPIYTMSLFWLPKSILKEIDRATSRFWWGNTKEVGHSFTPKSWASLCQPKSCGGLGFRKAEDSNRAMLSKIVWALTSNSNSLVSLVMKAKYENFIAPLQRLVASASSIWKGLNWCRSIMQAGTCFSIGKGASTSAWQDLWIPSNPLFKPSPNIGILAEPDTKVRDLMLFHPKRWNIPLLHNLFDQTTGALQTYLIVFAASDVPMKNLAPVKRLSPILIPFLTLASARMLRPTSVKSGAPSTLTLPELLTVPILLAPGIIQTCQSLTPGSPWLSTLPPCKLKPKQPYWQFHWPSTTDGVRSGLGPTLYC
ncbi:hypothetical protein CRG98_033936 [Punica granatum]|uniref:Reverse transcriptase zinc-binding domain-containing protein n=1 Tax=Punica granatum TaxID=22663 RepID=A0A2I0IPK8_PUNGR|nr:hypothetical protein CRG98_033936 [Punica granatum]